MELSRDLVKQVDEIREYMGFKSRKEFVEAAVHRLVKYYKKLLGS